MGYDLNDSYPDNLMRAYCRQEQTTRLKNLIYQREPGCIVMIGPRGAGKTTLIHEVVRQYCAEAEKFSCPEKISRLEKIWYLDPLRVISGMSIIGQWQRRLEAIIDYIRWRLKRAYRINRSDHLWIDNPVALLRIGKSSQNSLTMADVLKPYLEKRAFAVIIEATLEQWQKVEELDRSFADLFQVIRMNPPNQIDAVKMFTLQRALLEKEQRCQFTYQAISNLWALQAQYNQEDALPGSVIKILKQLAHRYKKQTIDVTKVNCSFQDDYHFQQKVFNRDQVLTEQEIMHYLDHNLIGQNRAKQCLADVIHGIKARLHNPEKPLAALLFIGPTGVGKTEAAKVLNQYLFATSASEAAANLVRFDMNEYIDADAAGRLIGDCQRPEGQLTSQVRYKRACVLLLDEIEKAHPSVHDLLLQVLGEGRLTDALGRTTSFSQCVIILTSNLGAVEAATHMGFKQNNQDRQASYQQAVEQFFRPEFLNRLDQQVVFEVLTAEDIVVLSRLQITKLLQRDGFVRRTTFLNITHESLDFIARASFDPLLGARALKRNIERSLVAMTARQLADIDATKPILLEIYLEQKQLKPFVVALEYATPQSQILPQATDAGLVTAYPELLQRIQYLEERVNDIIDHTAEQQKYSYWTLVERVRELEHVVEDICWDIDLWQNSIKSGQNFKIKRRSRLSAEWCAGSIKYHDLHAQLDIRDYLNETYNKAQSISELTNKNYLEHIVELDYLSWMLTALAAQGEERVCIHLSSCVDHLGQAEIAFLVQQYREALILLDASDIETIQQHDQCCLLGFGPGLSQIFAGETGLHLFYGREAKVVPVYVQVVKVAADTTDQQLTQQFVKTNLIQRPDLGKVLRIYALPELENAGLESFNKRHHDTITDLRTGLICRTHLSAHDWKLLFYRNIKTATTARKTTSANNATNTSG